MMSRNMLFVISLLSVFDSLTPTVANNDIQSEFEKLIELDLIDLMRIKISVASKRDEKITEAPSVISLVTASEIKKFGSRNLVDILNRVTSLQGLGSFFYSHVIGIRGQTFKHSNNDILFLINGRAHRTSWNGGANYSLLLGFPISMIERIEIIRGPGSVLYGSSAFTGVINIITKSAKNTDKASVSASYGSFNSKGIEASIGVESNHLDIAGGVKVFRSDGWKFEATGETGIRDSVDMKEDDIGLVFTADYRGFSINALYTDVEQDNLGVGARWPATSQTVEHLFLDAGYQQAISSSWDAEFHVTYNAFDINILDSGKRKSNDTLLEATIKGQPRNDLNFLFGGVYEYQEGSTGANNRYATKWYSGYAQTDYKPLDNLKLTAGLQWNKPEGIGSDISPRLGMVYNITQGWTGKLLYGEAFRAAYATEREINTPRIKGDPNLDPETIKTTEAQLLYNTRAYSASVTYFHSDIDDVITRTPSGEGVFTFVNKGEIQFDGIELEGRAALNHMLSVVGSASYQMNKDDKGIEDVTLAPNFIAKLGFVYKASSGYTLGVFDSYFGEPNEVKELNPLVSEVNATPDAYHLLSINLVLDISRLVNIAGISSMNFSLYGNNLLDEEINYPEFIRKNINAIPIHSGRGIYGTLKINF